MGVHEADKRSEPVGGDFHIVVEQHGVLGIHLGESTVVALRKAVVLVKGNDTHGGKFSGKQSQRAICRSVVGHYHLHALALAVAYHRGEKLAQQVLGVPIEYDDGNFHHSLSIIPVSAVPSAFKLPRRTRTRVLSFKGTDVGAISTRM